jgi:hypothetical protein
MDSVTMADRLDTIWSGEGDDTHAAERNLAAATRNSASSPPSADG